MKHTAIFTCLSITTPHQVGSTSEVKVKQRRSYETCYTPLLNADADNDGRLSEEEYTQYVIDNSDDVASSARGYKDLTFELQIAFVYLDCLCGDGEMGNCCDGYIDISGSRSNEIPTYEQFAHLNQICSKTQNAIDKIPSSGTITDAPTRKPASVAPTDSPVSFKPSVNPSASPTKSPTSSPNAMPTKSPTMPPSASPSSFIHTSEQSDSPTSSPFHSPSNNSTVESIILKPSVNPSLSPSQKQHTGIFSSSPVLNPTIRPDENPTTLMPSINISSNPSQQPTAFPSISPVQVLQDAPVTLSPSLSPSKATLSPVSYVSTSTPSLVTTLQPNSSGPVTSSTSYPESKDTPPPSVSPIIYYMNTQAPSPAVDNRAPLTNDPTEDEFSDRPSISPSFSNFKVEDSGTDSVEKDNVAEAEKESLSAGVIFGVLFPLVAIIAAGIFVFASSRRQEHEALKYASMDDEGNNSPDEEFGESRDLTHPHHDSYGVASAATNEISIHRDRTTNLGIFDDVVAEDKNKVIGNVISQLAESREGGNQHNVIVSDSSSEEDTTYAQLDIAAATEAPNCDPRGVEPDKMTASLDDTKASTSVQDCVAETRDHENFVATAVSSVGSEDEVKSTFSQDAKSIDVTLRVDKNADDRGQNKSNRSSANESTSDDNQVNSLDESDPQIGSNTLIIADTEILAKLSRPSNAAEPKGNIDDTLQDLTEERNEPTPSMLNLRAAIERRDWHSVGQAASIMARESTADLQVGHSHEILYLEKEDRIKHLDEMIAQGDWVGIVTVAGQYQALDNDLDVVESSEHSVDEVPTEPKVNESSLSSNLTELEEIPHTYVNLEQAIEKGDWRAVGQAAAIMDKESMPLKSACSTGSPVESSSQHMLHSKKEDRIKQLDELIAQGDWIGVVIASGQYQAMDEDLGLKL